MIRHGLALLALAAATGVACAADLPSAAAPPPRAARISADVTGFSIGPIVGTLGAGGEIGYRFSDLFGARVDATALPATLKLTTATAPYTARISYFSAGLLADYYPFGGALRLTGGLHINDDSLKLHAAPGAVTINGATFTAAQVGTLDADIRYNALAPYLGVGMEGAPTSSRNFVIGFDAGAMYQGSPRASVTASNAGIPASFLASEQAALQSDARKYNWYPVVTLAAKYRF
jgi:hypothetical protein